MRALILVALAAVAMSMTRQELTDNFNAAILYYLDGLDAAVHWSSDLSSVCTPDYDFGLDPPQKIIQADSWLPDIVDFPEPDIADLMMPSVVDVMDFYTPNYAIPDSITAAQSVFAKFSTTQLNTSYVDDDMDGYVVFDSTVKRLKYYNRGNLSWTLL